MGQNNPFVQRQILFVIQKFLFPRKTKDLEKKHILIHCLQANGYIIEKEPVKHSESDDEEFMYTKSDTDSDSENEIPPYSETATFLPSIQQREHTSTDLYGFTRTFIEPTNGTVVEKRLLEVQKRGITPEEMDFIKVSDAVDTALQHVPGINFEHIKRVALNMYLNITKFYAYQENVQKSERLIKGDLKGSVKKGYVPMVVYYSLLQNGICISRDTLIQYFDGVNSSDLPQADKNIKIIFQQAKNYQFIYSGIQEQCFCNIQLTTDQKRSVQKVISDLQSAGLFSKPARTVDVASSIYFVLKNNVNLISSKCGITDDTIRKHTKGIERFYQK
jgi:hypothetical protein